MAGTELDLNERIDIALAVGGYLRAVDRFDVASKALNKACSELRAQIKGRTRFVVQAENRHFLVLCDRDGNFDVEQIESL